MEQISDRRGLQKSSTLDSLSMRKGGHDSRPFSFFFNVELSQPVSRQLGCLHLTLKVVPQAL